MNFDEYVKDMKDVCLISCRYDFLDKPLEYYHELISNYIEQGKTKIVFDHWGETIFKQHIEKIEEIYFSMSLPSTVKFYYNCSAVNPTEVYATFCYNRGVDQVITMIYKMEFQENYREEINGRNLSIEYNIAPKHKVFTCFNRMARYHRVAFLVELIKNNLLDEGYVSFGYGDENIFLTDIFKRPYKFPREIIDNRSLFPLKLNMTSIRQNPLGLLDTDIYYHNNSYFSIVTETLFYTSEEEKDCNYYHTASDTLDSYFFTEKVFRPIGLKHPFILMSRYRSLAKLKEFGFKTFHPFINEHYDEILCGHTRMTAIKDEVMRLCNFTVDEWKEWQHNVKDIVEHNFNVLTSSVDVDNNYEIIKAS